MGDGGKVNTIPMGMKSTLKTLISIGVKVNTVPMEIVSTMKILKGKL
jgi:hypothetical protein